MNSMDDIGSAFIRSLWELLKIDVTQYCNAAVDAAFVYCIQVFKKACETAGIEWQEEWENILYEK